MKSVKASRSGRKPVILVLMDYYLPAHKAGGPVRTVANMVSQLAGDFDFKIITRDRDLGDIEGFASIEPDKWQSVGQARVYYMSPRMKTLANLKRLLNEEDYDLLYVNSFFSPFFSVLPAILRQLKLVKQKQLILAPRGELSEAALKLKYLRKRIYLWAVRLTRLHTTTIFQASTDMELGDIRQMSHRWFLSDVRIARDLFAHAPNLEDSSRPPKMRGGIDIVFVSRITAMKNLDFVLECLEGVTGRVRLNIYGPVDRDVKYWAQCQAKIRALPENIIVKHHGAVAHDEVLRIFGRHHLFFLPTRGENFGHVIVEALLAGCPVLISDRTPWTGVEEAGAGWALPLSGHRSFREVLERMIEWDERELSDWSCRAKAFAKQVMEDPDILEQNRRLFNEGIRKTLQ